MKPFHLVLLTLIILMSGCVRYKEYPFPYDKNITIDKRLSGTWKINIEKTDFQKLFHKKKPKNNKEVITFIPNETNTLYDIDTGSAPLYKAYTSKLKTHTYLNFAPATNLDEYNHYKYTITDNELIIYMQNPKVLTEDIKNRKLWGDVSKNGILPIVNIFIVEDAKSYKQYLLENDSRIYDLPLYLVRIKK